MYRALHVGIHCGWPKATLEANNAFPACPTCGNGIRYALGRTWDLPKNAASEPQSRIRAVYL